MWCLRLKTKVLPQRRTFFRACESGLWLFERKKVFFCECQRKKVFFRRIQRKKVKKVLPQVKGEPTLTHGRTLSSADSRGRTCGTFFRRLPLLLAEEPAEPSSSDHVLLYIDFFFLKIMSEPPIY